MKPWSLTQTQDEEVFQLIEQELLRQQHGIELIASENFASEAVISTMANVMTNKYAEGLPHKRYYGGCQIVDKVEELAIHRVCKLFGANFANVQPHSGAQANAATLLALAPPGSKILGMDLSHGGHLTHGSKVNFSGIYYDAHSYTVDPETEMLNYEHIAQVADQVRPKILIAGASAYPRAINFKKFREIADSVDALLMVDMAHIAGLIAAGEHENPIAHAHVVTSTTHKTLRGPRGGIILWNDEALSPKINKGVFPGTQGGPLEHIIAAKAVCFKEAQQDTFKQYQKQVRSCAQALAQSLEGYGFNIVSKGTDNHLVLLSLLGDEVSGKDLEKALGQVAITVNKNTVPRETRSPFVTSGIRLGTPAVTSRGMGPQEMEMIAKFIKETYLNRDNTSKLKEISNSVTALAKSFPLYPSWS